MNRFFEMMGEVYHALGLSGVRISVSTRPAEFLGEPADWDKAEQTLIEAVTARRLRVRHQAGRGGLLRAEDRVRLRRRARSLLDARDDPDGHGDARPLRAPLRRPRRRRAPARHAAPRDARLARALHRALHRAHRRRLPALARAGAGRGRDGHRPRRRVRRGACATRSPRPACAPSSTTAARSSASRCARPSCRRFRSSPCVGDQEAAERNRHAAPAPRARKARRCRCALEAFAEELREAIAARRA